MNWTTLDLDLGFKPDDLKIGIPIVLGLIGFIIFWFTQESAKVKARFYERWGEDQGSANFILFTKCLGAFSMGVLPAIVYFIVYPESSLSELGLSLRTDTFLPFLAWTVGLSAILIPVSSFSARKPEGFDFYPQIRAKVWDRKLIITNIAAWSIYLLGYEFYFRGLLFFPLVETIGVWPAIAVNIGMYSATHIPKSMQEAIGAIFLSVVLCILTLQTGHIWIAFWVHLAMALSNSFTALKFNPAMTIGKRD
jgi:membrane protease YdiL (CAAX protease family)